MHQLQSAYSERNAVNPDSKQQPKTLLTQQNQSCRKLIMRNTRHALRLSVTTIPTLNNSERNGNVTQLKIVHEKSSITECMHEQRFHPVKTVTRKQSTKNTEIMI